MARKTADISLAELLSPILKGRVTPGSDKGRELLRGALERDPEGTVLLIRPIDPAALREGMRASLIPEKRVAELLRLPRNNGKVSDPFQGGPGLEPGGPFPDPAEQMRRGPTPFGHS
jgi:hypothetical protein